MKIPIGDTLAANCSPKVGHHLLLQQLAGGLRLLVHAVIALFAVVAFHDVAIAQDSVPPSVPTNVVATSINASVIRVTWSASTDNVAVTSYRIERCEGNGCGNYVQVAQLSYLELNYTSYSLNQGTSYSFRVRAGDGAGNQSEYSAVASATTGIPPSTPTGLQAVGANPNMVNLSWNAATDDVAVTGYRVYRCQGAGCTNLTQIGQINSPETHVTLIGLQPSTSYTHAVRAVDAQTNFSEFSNLATAVTLTEPDTVPPTVPTGLVASPIDASTIKLTWTASTDDVGVWAYEIERCTGPGCANFVIEAFVYAPTYSDSGLTPGITYRYRIAAADGADNFSAFTEPVAATASEPAQSQMYYIHPDHLNTPRLVADATGSTVWRWDQAEPFGNNPADENPSGLGAFDLPLRLPGQYFDKETNTHYNYFRDYDAAVGRYIQSDPIGLEGGINTYAYVGGNPLSWTDPTGEAIPVIYGVAWAVAQIGGRIAIGAAARSTARAGIAAATVALSQTRSAEEQCDMFRAMIPGPDGFPIVAPTARGLGVRPGIDVPQTDPGAIVIPGPQGMSVSPSLATLPPFRTPPQFGGTGKDPAYCMCRSNLPPTLMYVPDPANPGGHGFVSPALPTPLGAYQSGLGSTRNQWRVVR